LTFIGAGSFRSKPYGVDITSKRISNFVAPGCTDLSVGGDSGPKCVSDVYGGHIIRHCFRGCRWL
jgi:hypothetical protein